MQTQEATQPAQGDAGRPSEGRTQGGGFSRHIPHLTLFNRFTYTSEKLSDGTPTEKPYYCYDAEVMILKGFCDPAPIARTLEKEGLYPVLGPDGQALASVWINDLRDSVIGPYREIVFALDATTEPNHRARFRAQDPYGLLYNFFGGPCLNYLHTLYINSPLSIRWGREMQAFPKHPEPTTIAAEFGPQSIRFEVGWENKLLLAGSVTQRWGAAAFMRQCLGLLLNFGPARVLGFLANPVVRLPIVMPKAVRDQYAIRWNHTGHILKGYNPVGIRTWPWSEQDRLELGTGRQAEATDGQESPTDLWHDAGFRPQIVVHVPSLQLVVTDNPA